MSKNQEKRKREADVIPLDQFHEALQRVPLELPNGVVSILYSERAVHALRMAHQFFLQVVAAELAQAEGNMLSEGHAEKALNQVGFADLCTRARTVLAANAAMKTTTTAATASSATISSATLAGTNAAVSNSEPKKKRKKMVKKVITKEMEDEQTRLFQQSVTMQQQKRNEEKLAGAGP
jgi:hypothetical protein